jgi:hypothetical protein
MLVIKPPPGSLLRIQSEFGIALAALHIAGRRKKNQNAERQGQEMAVY